MEVVMQHLQTDPKSGVLSFRRKFPKDLVRFIPSKSPSGGGRIELKVSLRAREINAPGALDRYRAAERNYQALVDMARKAASGTFDALDEARIARLAAYVLHEGLADHEEALAWPDPIARKRWRAETLKETIAPDLAESRTYRALGDIEGVVDVWGDEAMSLAAMEGLTIDRSSPSFARLCSAINDAQIAAWEGTLARLQGDRVPTSHLTGWSV